MQRRDLSRLEAASFDVLVVGGGIYGLAIAYEAASRGLSTALVEAADFGGGISFNHQKTAHGGLRSLQSMRLDRAREAIRERRALARIAPGLLRPMPFIVGTYRSVMKGRLALRAAFKLDGWLGRRRNDGVERELHLPVPRLLSRPLTLKLFPGIREQDLTGGAQWYDYQIVQNDRLTFAFAGGADRAGAVLANYVEATAAIIEAGRVVGMTARDVETGGRVSIRAALTINAAGSRATEVMGLLGVRREVPLMGTMNLVTTRPAREMALAAPTAAGRMLTLVPWRGRAIVGTSHGHGLATPGARATAAEVDRFIGEANEAFPALALTRDTVALVHWGLVPAVTAAGRAPDLLSAPLLLDHARDGAPGAMTVVGVKYTTARGVAERAVTLAARLLARPVRRSATATTVLPGAGIADHEALAIETARKLRIGIAPPILTRLAEVYAERSADIVRLMVDEESLREPLTTDSALTGAEVVHVIRHEMALHLTDVVLRRTGIGAAGHPGKALLNACARIAARELGWDEATSSAELAAVEQAYVTPRAGA
jgi:glycerol-3-phosphate dehydrogenase